MSSVQCPLDRQVGLGDLHLKVSKCPDNVRVSTHEDTHVTKLTSNETDLDAWQSCLSLQ
jgi:hypothetical protein